MERSPHFILDRIVRWSSWPLIAFLLVFFATGYAMSGRYGFGGLLDAKQALAIHKLCHFPLAALVSIHSLPAMYLACRRWGWFGGRKAP
jgi:hypothetical protein